MRLSIGAVCKAGGSRNNYTGSWRAYRPVVDMVKCTKCGICESFCPDICIEIEENGCCINYNYCKGCGICKHECPSKAIVMEVE